MHGALTLSMHALIYNYIALCKLIVDLTCVNDMISAHVKYHASTTVRDTEGTQVTRKVFT